MRALAVLLAVPLLVGVLTSCDAGDPLSSLPPSSASGSPTGTPSTTQVPARDALTESPSDDVAALLEQLRLAQGSTGRRAAEFQQLAARHLAGSPERLRQNVLRQIDDPGLQANVEAAGLLSAMTDPQPRLPEWRIVAPPPASELLRHYRAAERATGVPWEYLAAIHLVETRMGRIRGTSTAGAQGPMQFLPSTWAAYGAGGDIESPRDAIHAAGRLLAANGAPGNMAGALWNYNHSDSYVRAVSLYAGVMRRTPSAYRAYWHWRVLYKHSDGSVVLPNGYPREKPVPLG